MKKTKPSKKKQLSGDASAFAKTVNEFITTGRHPKEKEALAFLAIEESANKMEEILNDRKLTPEQKVSLLRKYVGLVQEAVIDATSFTFTLTK